MAQDPFSVQVRWTAGTWGWQLKKMQHNEPSAPHSALRGNSHTDRLSLTANINFMDNLTCEIQLSACLHCN